MLPNFSESFAALVDRIEQSLPEQFTPTRSVNYAGRTAALSAVYEASEAKKLMGLMATKQVSHCHEFRLFYEVPHMRLDLLEDWWEFARRLQQEIVPVDPNHEFSMVSIILVSGEVDAPVVRKLKGKSSELRYNTLLQAGWSSVRMAVVDLEQRKIYTNRMGGPLRDLLKPLL